MGWTDESERSISGCDDAAACPLPGLPTARPDRKSKCRRTDSNRRPRAYETRALNQLSYSGQNFRLYYFTASCSTRAAASSGIISS